MNTSSASIPVGNTDRPNATVSPDSATNQAVTWSSDDEGVATVSADGLGAGSALDVNGSDVHAAGERDWPGSSACYWLNGVCRELQPSSAPTKAR